MPPGQNFSFKELILELKRQLFISDEFHFSGWFVTNFCLGARKRILPTKQFYIFTITEHACFFDVDLWPQDHFPNQNSLSKSLKFEWKKLISKQKLKLGGGSWSGVSGHAAWFWLQPIEVLGGSRGATLSRWHCAHNVPSATLSSIASATTAPGATLWWQRRCWQWWHCHQVKRAEEGD